MEKIIIIAAGIIFVSAIVLILVTTLVNAKNKKLQNDLIYEHEVLWKQTEKIAEELDNAQKEIAHLNTVREHELNSFNEAYESVIRTNKAVKKACKTLRKRIEDIGTDFSHRNVIGSQYKVGELLYHVSPKTGKIEKHKVVMIEFNDYGTEFDVDYHFSYGNLEYSISEDSCFKDESVAKMILIEQP